MAHWDLWHYYEGYVFHCPFFKIGLDNLEKTDHLLVADIWANHQNILFVDIPTKILSKPDMTSNCNVPTVKRQLPPLMQSAKQQQQQQEQPKPAYSIKCRLEIFVDQYNKRVGVKSWDSFDVGWEEEWIGSLRYRLWVWQGYWTQCLFCDTPNAAAAYLISGLFGLPPGRLKASSAAATLYWLAGRFLMELSRTY